jgi:hypothetical protein
MIGNPRAAAERATISAPPAFTAKKRSGSLSAQSTAV